MDRRKAYTVASYLGLALPFLAAFLLYGGSRPATGGLEVFASILGPVGATIWILGRREARKCGWDT